MHPKETATLPTRACRPTVLVLLALFVLPFLAASLSAQPPAADRKMIVLGFDGADAKLAQQWMDEGKLPNLAKLRQQGTFAPLRSTIPSQTPVSWSTFSTGLSPGRHGIFDFLKRDPATYRPSFAAADVSRAPFLFGERNPLVLGAIATVVLALLLLLLLKLFRMRTKVAAAVAVALGLVAGVGTGYAASTLLPTSRPVAINNQQGDTFWALLGKAGKRVEVMRVPVTFPPKAYEHGHLLTGLGTPDLSARIGKPFYFTSELFFQPKGGGDFSVEVTELVDNRGVIDTEIKGPPNELFPPAEGEEMQYISIPMRLTVAEDRSSLGIEVSGTQLSLKPGEWSDWVAFSFPFNRLIKVGGIGKFRLVSLDPEVRLYLSPIQFDPKGMPPGLEITTPADFIDQLASRFGRFKTIGWMIDTWSLPNGTIDEQVFLEDVRQTVDKEKEILRGLLADDD
ncbi:MAG TPA: alkaline phosphatase family protein, partial [Thermoanaerobaculia bacterium]|nr:alkaline phosphatase family protein [Thermoanaerobaculia bacterium]